MDSNHLGNTREDFWRLQEALNELSTTQQQHAERIMRLEKRNEDGSRSRSVWGSSSPFPPAAGSSQHDSSLNPAAEAFRNFDADPPNNMITSLTLDGNEDARRAAAASRANSVRFDESANNHYGPSRTSIDLPTRTGSGLGSHPLSERSLSHRSERGSSAGFGRTNSFGLEASRLLGSIHNSPRVSGNPPPGFFMLGPCPSIIRCWLAETFSHDSLLYAALCTGSSQSSISLSLLQRLGLTDSIIEENGLRKVRLLVYLTEARIQQPSSRSGSPAPQVPTVTAKFLLYDRQPDQDRSIQIVLGSDVLRVHSADILFSQDKVMLFDDDRNQVSIPLVRPEDDAVYKNLATVPRSQQSSVVARSALQPDGLGDHSTPGVIGRPSRSNATSAPTSPADEDSYITPSSNSGEGSLRRMGQLDTAVGQNNEMNLIRGGEDSKSATGSEKSAGASAAPRSASGVWSNSWRSSTGAVSSDGSSAPGSSMSGTWSKTGPARPMKVLRPGRSMASINRTTSVTSPSATGLEVGTENIRSSVISQDQVSAPSSAVDPKTPVTKSNPIGGASAFGWLNSGQPRKTTTNGNK